VVDYGFIDEDTFSFTITNNSNSSITAFAFNATGSVNYYPNDVSGWKNKDGASKISPPQPVTFGEFDYGMSTGNSKQWKAGDTKDGITNGNSKTFNFEVSDNFQLINNADGYAFIVRYQGVGDDVENLPGKNSDSDVGGSPVPVPAAAWLLGSGMLGLLVLRRRRSS
jgi:hypothetical protein